METAHWIAEHWFDLFQTAGVLIGFVFTIHALRTESEARKIGNMIALNQEHRGAAFIVLTSTLSSTDSVFAGWEGQPDKQLSR